MIRNQVLLLCLLMMMVFQAKPQQGMETKSISIFKNGSAFFIKSGNLSTTNSNIRFTDSLPRALFGTYWMLSPTNDLKSVRSFKDKVKKQQETNTIAEMLNANIGKKVRFSFHNKDKVIEGTIQQFIKAMLHTGPEN